MGKAPKLWPGNYVQQYRILEVLSKRGGVYRAQDDYGGDVVLKHQESDRTTEVQVLRMLNHHGIVRLEGVFCDEEDPRLPWYAVLEFVNGTSFDQLRGRLPEQEIFALGAHVADALCCVHKAGFAYSDLSGTNAWRVKKRARLIDFGACTPIGLKNVVLHGTPGYRSPQHIENKSSPKNDVFSLGALLYSLKTGDTPYVTWDELLLQGTADAMAEYEYDCMRKREPRACFEDKEMQQLASAMLTTVDSERITMDEAATGLLKYLN